MVITKKRGRPFKYQDDNIRYEKRKENNRINQQKCRLRKKLHQEINKSKNQKSFTYKYRTDLIQFIEQFDFDYFFTGTVDMNYLEREELKKRNLEITQLNTEYNLTLNHQTEKRISLEILKSYTERYVQLLSDKNLFERCFVVFEKGKYNKYHTHILFKSNPEKINFEMTTENSWLLGTQTITVPVYDKSEILSYMSKELDPISSKNSDQKLVDSWFIRGDFDKEKVSVKPYLPELKLTLTL